MNKEKVKKKLEKLASNNFFIRMLERYSGLGMDMQYIDGFEDIVDIQKINKKFYIPENFIFHLFRKNNRIYLIKKWFYERLLDESFIKSLVSKQSIGSLKFIFLGNEYSKFYRYAVINDLVFVMTAIVFFILFTPLFASTFIAYSINHLFNFFLSDVRTGQSDVEDFMNTNRYGDVNFFGLQMSFPVFIAYVALFAGIISIITSIIRQRRLLSVPVFSRSILSIGNNPDRSLFDKTIDEKKTSYLSLPVKTKDFGPSGDDDSIIAVINAKKNPSVVFVNKDAARRLDMRFSGKRMRESHYFNKIFGWNALVNCGVRVHSVVAQNLLDRSQKYQKFCRYCYLFLVVSGGWMIWNAEKVGETDFYSISFALPVVTIVIGAVGFLSTFFVRKALILNNPSVLCDEPLIMQRMQ